MDHVNKMLAATRHLYEEPAGLGMMRELNALKDKINPIFATTDWVRQMSELRPYQMTAVDYLSDISMWKNTVPHTAITALESIFGHQTRFYNNINALKLPEIYTTVSELRSMQMAMSGLSGSLVNFYAVAKQWEELDDFNDFTDSVANLEEDILNKEEITKQDIAAIFDFFNVKFSALEQKIARIGKDRISKLMIYLTVASFIIGCIALIPNHNVATKDDIENLRKSIYKKLEDALADTTHQRVVSRNCFVTLKPKSKSLVLNNLDSGVNVTVIQVHHKWVYISFIDSEDNLVHTGWVLKKYLFK